MSDDSEDDAQDYINLYGKIKLNEAEKQSASNHVYFMMQVDAAEEPCMEWGSRKSGLRLGWMGLDCIGFKWVRLSSDWARVGTGSAG